MSKGIMDSSSQLRRAAEEAKRLGGEVLHGGPERSLLWKWSLGCVRNDRMLEVPKLWNFYQGDLYTGSGPAWESSYRRQNCKGRAIYAFGIRDGATGFTVCSAGFPAPVFPYDDSIPPFRMGMCAIVCRKQVICSFILQEFTNKGLS